MSYKKIEKDNSMKSWKEYKNKKETFISLYKERSNKKNQVEILELKNLTNKIKNSTESINSKIAEQKRELVS